MGRKKKEVLRVPDTNKPLKVRDFVINPADKQGEFEIEITSSKGPYEYITLTDAQSIIQYLLEAIKNAKKT
jgi:hypothetical protein